MQVDNLLIKAKAGDRQALAEWFQDYQDRVVKIAFQAGLPKQQIGRVQLAVIEALHKKIETINEENAEKIVFQTAVQMVEKQQTGLEIDPDVGALKFQEDQEAHKALLKLPVTERLAVMLVHFHGKSVEEAAEILSTAEPSVDFAIHTGLEKLREEMALESRDDVEKRLALLDKSYNRIDYSQAAENVEADELQIDEPIQKKEPQQIESGTTKKIALLAGVSLFLAAVIGSSFFFNDQPSDTQTASEEENPTKVSKEMINEWQAEYEEIRSSAPERLGLPAETFEQLEYVQKADALKERTFSRQNIRQLRDDPERMQDQVEVLMLSIQTPKSMLESAEDYKLDPMEISKFLVIYTEKTDQLMVIADGLLEKHKEQLAVAKREGELAPDLLMNNRESFPEDIKNLTASLSEYTFQYIAHPNDNRFRTVRDVNKFYEVRPFSTDGLSNHYVEIIRNAPFYDETGMLMPTEQIPYLVMTMAVFLYDPSLEPALKNIVEPLLANTFYAMVKGDFKTEVFDGNGVVKEEFRIAWKTSVQLGMDPATYLLLPILEEFEASGWKESPHFDELALPDILGAIELERNGELAEKLPNSDLEINFASLDLKNYDYSDIIPLYEEFSVSHDLNILSGAEPMETIKLYYYANKIEDIETMWHLTADDKLKPPLDEYKEKWRKQPEITGTSRILEYRQENMSRQGREMFMIISGSMEAQSNNFQPIQNMILITQRDQIWLMQHQIDEFYAKDESFEEYDSNVRSHYKKLTESGKLADVENATPAEIAGVFLLALENEDIRTMRLLLNKGEVQIGDEEFKNRWITPGHFPAYSKVEGIAFRVDGYNIGIQEVRGYVDIYKNIITRENGAYLPLEKVGDSWMIGDMFSY